jgi:DNA-directed RNA polymerase III subunit RPC6
MATDLADLSDQFLRFLQRSESEVSDDLIKEHFGSKYHELSGCINTLLSQNRIIILKDATQLFYRAVREETAEKFQGLMPDQMLVYQVCERAGNKGIWTRDIKLATNVQQQSLTKTLKMLSDRNLIKSVRSVVSKSKKLYMLYDVEPAKEVTGGPWYTDQEFDHEFIEELCNFIVRYVNDKGITNVNDINDRVRISGISKVELTIDELEQVLQILVS